MSIQESEPPIRLDEYIPTFPNFQLSACSALVSDLNLDSNSRLDFWQGQEWVTVNIQSVLTVEKAQRILLKIRPNIRQSLKNCPGIEDELSLQPKSYTRGLKRLATSSFVSPVKKIPRTQVDQQVSKSDSPPPEQLDVVNQEQLESTREHTVTPQTIQREKKWPLDFFVHEIHRGFRSMDKRLTLAYTDGGRSKLTAETAFIKAFPGVKYAKTTVWKYKKMWDGSDIAVRNLFIDLGTTNRAKFKHFLSALSNPNAIPSDETSEENSSESESDKNKSDSDSDATNNGKSNHRNKSNDNLSEDDDFPLPGQPIFLSNPTARTLANKTHHVNDSKHQPKNAWPVITDYAYSSLRQRILDIREDLEEIVLEPSESEFFMASKRSYSAGSSSEMGGNGLNGYAG